jgi:hypothetical protein
MSPNVPDLFSPCALSLTRKKSASSLLQLLMYWVPRIVSNLAFSHLSEAHLFRSMCSTKSLFEEKEVHPESGLALRCSFEWHGTCYFGN